MPTSFTTYFNLGKPENGDLDWGPIVNGNMDAVDAALQAAKDASNLTSGTVSTARLPLATDSALGLVKGFTNLTISGQGALSLTSSNVTAALGYTPVNPSSKGVAGGYASLDSNGFVPSSQLSLSTNQIAEDIKLFFTVERAADAAPVQSVAGKTGTVTLTTADISESGSLYYTTQRFDDRLATKTTDDLTQGSSNLYWSSSLFNTAFGAKTTSDLAEGSNLYYTAARFDTRFAAKTTDNLAEGVANFYWTAARFNSAFSGKSTSDLTEGLNLYYTAERVNTRIENHSRAFKGIANDSGTVQFSAASYDDTLKLAASTGVEVAFDAENKKVTFSNTGVTSVNGQAGDVTVVASLAARSFAQLNVIGDLPSHAADAVVNDFYMNTDGAKTLRKIIVSALQTPASGAIVVDIKLVTTQGGSAVSLFPIKTKPTVTCADSSAWVVLTGSSLDSVQIPDNSMIQVSIVSAPAGSSDLRVELFE